MRLISTFLKASPQCIINAKLGQKGPQVLHYVTAVIER